MLLKKKLWTSFVAIVSLGVIFLFLIVYIIHYTLESREKKKLIHYANVMKVAIHADFENKEYILDKIIENILHNEEFHKIKDLDPYLSEKEGIFALRFTLPNGDVIYTTSNIKNKLINLLRRGNSKEDFEKTLNSKNMVVGKTVYYAPLKRWIIPIRKAVYKDSKLIGVITAWLLMETKNNYLSKIDIPLENRIIIAKAKNKNGDIYIQYISNLAPDKQDQLYLNPIKKEERLWSEKDILKRYDLTMEELKQRELTIDFMGDGFAKKKVFAGLVFDKEYGIWIIIQMPYDTVSTQILKISLIVFIIFLLVISIIYYLFSKIASSEEKQEGVLMYKNHHDSLTGLPNREYMYEKIQEWVEAKNHRYDILYIDLDNFKNINDHYGHKIGDEILIEAAKRLSSFVNRDDLLIRQGGDEFIIFKKKDEGLKDFLVKLIEETSVPYKVSGKEFRIGMSIGIAESLGIKYSIGELLSLADTAMYEAKKTKNSFVFFAKEMLGKTVERANIEQELRGALKRGEVWMEYQPQITIDGGIHGVEALVRWKNEELGFIGPDKFIQVAEETGIMKSLGYFILERSLSDISILKQDLEENFNLSINISVIQFMDDDFLETVLSLVDKYKYKKEYLTIEITESLSITNLDKIIPILDKIREKGIKVSFDDFGTGYSSLSMLKKLPIDELKIDKSFVDDILTDKKIRVVIDSIINIGKSFNMKIVAEGVENLDQIKSLKSLNCDFFQGYYYSRPLRIDTLREYIKNQKIRCKE